jgi:hypothetical protein
MMFEKYMIVPEEAKNLSDKPNHIIGFQFGARLPYYRGLELSMVEEIKVKVDGAPVPTDNLSITLHGNTYTLAQLETEYADRWEMGEVAIVCVKQEGGLSPGQHQLELLLNLRISYMPFPQVRQSTKMIYIA